MADNGRRVTARELADKLDVVRAEQKAAHLWTRLVVVAVMAVQVGLTGAPAILAWVGWRDSLTWW